MGIFYSGSALAASVNDVEKADGVITDEFIYGSKDQGNANSGKFVIGQGNLDIQTSATIQGIINRYQQAIKNDSSEIEAIEIALRPVEGNATLAGVVGGEGKIDDGTFGTLAIFAEQPNFGDAIRKIIYSNTIGQGNNNVTIGDDENGNINVVIGNDKSYPVIIGYAGGDLVLNPGVTATTEAPSVITIDRIGNINTTINNGTVLGGTGASAAISAGNITGSISVPIGENSNYPLPITTEGNTTTTVKGNVTTNVYDKANLGAFVNGGAAIAIGGTAVSKVDGNTTVNIDTAVETNGNLDGIVAGVAGGGVAITTIGGTAESTVTGTSTVDIDNGLVIGVAGGGVAGAGDATGAVEAIKNDGLQIGNNNGVSDKDIELDLGDGQKLTANVSVAEAIEGGKATATTGDTKISLSGKTTAIGLIGGGIAASSHTYQEKDAQNNSTDKQLGRSTAIANTGKVNITVNLEADKDKVADAIAPAVGSVINTVADIFNSDKQGESITVDGVIESLKDINISTLEDQGAAIGVIGGGIAFGHGTLGGSMDDANGSFATANTEGAVILLQKGYAAGVFGGGVAVTDNIAQATTNSTDVYIGIGQDMKAVGVFGGGIALSMEGSKGKAAHSDILATSHVENNTIEIYGEVDGAYGGGMAFGNSAIIDAGNDAVASVTNSNIIVNAGSVDNLNIDRIMEATQNENTDGKPWWNRLGVNAGMALADLKGITDETSIAAGGIGMSMTGYADVTTANITINGGTVAKDILGGGIAVDNMKEGSGAHVGTSTITLNGGTVEGSVYAGGATNGTTAAAVNGTEYENDKEIGYSTTNTASLVDKAIVVLNGTEVKGEISGEGYKLTTNYEGSDYDPMNYEEGLTYTKEANESDTVTTSNLEITGNNTLSALDTTKGSYVGTNKIHSFDSIDVMADSVTTLIGLTPETNAVIDATGTQVDVAGSAKLDINDFAKAENFGNTYKVISNTDETDKAWTDSNLVYDRTEGYAAGTEVKTGNYDITYKSLTDLNEEEQKKAVNDFVGSLGENGEELRGNVEGIVRNGDNTFAGAKDFFADATSTADNSGLAAMAMIGEAAGVSSNTISVAGDMADNSVLRLSFTQDDITGEPKVNEDGAIWAKYIHNKHDLDGMASSFGSVDSSSDFDGATIGVDFAKKGKVQSGIAFSYGSGDSHGMGINNDFDMWGVSLYGNVKNDDTNVIADIGFSESDNELTGTAMGKDIKADRDVSVFTVGVRAEKLYTNGSTQIVPYTGLRYYNVDPDSYTAYYDGQKFGEYDADRQNIWTLPVGVSLRNETVTESGWRLTPKVDVAYIWAFGDTDNSFDLNTGSGVDTLDYTVMDSGSWLGSVGFEAGKDDWAFGVGYSYQKGSHEEANKWFVNVEYSF